ncbi:MAG: sensor histidine kinase [Candidatus Pseudobacter hemicellulosilyticus]|uniref:Sensor histidine kinase n=1 Tax=Candidatus Pseudobacter hemicellulosilyticus TaxID=3121375 RepID=A0AAJ5WPH9_9BACT|nr:MAG: sensor histidine kinase [Pseudobacter sp.]
MRRILLLLLLSTTACFSVYAQDEEDPIPGMLRQLAQSKADTNRINLLYEIQTAYLDVDNDSALYYNKQCESLINELKAAQFRHRCYHEFVRIYHAMFNYDQAMIYCVKALEVAHKDNNTFQQATSYRALFNLYYNLGKDDSAIKYGQYAIRLSEQIGDSANVSIAYGNICRIYSDLGQYDQAIEYGKKGVAYGERYKDYKGMLISMNNLGSCYLRLSRNAEAIEIFNKQFEIGEKVKRSRSVLNALLNLGIIYHDIADKENLAKIAVRMRALEPSFDTADHSGISHRHIIYGYDHLLQSRFPQAEQELLTGLTIAEKDSIESAMLKAYLGLASLKYAQHDFKAGSEYETLWDTLTYHQQAQQLAEYSLDLEKKYETEKKDTQLKLQQAAIRQKDMLNYFLIASALALLVIILLSYRNYRHKQKLQQQRITELEKEQQLMATEAVLKGEEQERTRLAKDLHDGLGGMLSSIKYSLNSMKSNLAMSPAIAQGFDRSMDMLDSSIHEMRRVAHNMMPEALVKFGLDAALRDFCNDINQSGALKVSYQSYGLEDHAIDQSTAITIYRIVQELLNNTLKHAAAQQAIVQVSRSGEDISITVEDDGRGFSPIVLKDARGIGWSNIQSRVEYLKGRLDVQSAPGKGTSVLIELKA